LEEKKMSSLNKQFDITVNFLLEKFEKEKKQGLHGWFSRNKGKGWVDCKTGKPCGRQKGEKRKGYPACRPTMAQCNSRSKYKKGAKRISWKKGEKT
jgi:hypothetical protein